MSTAAPAKSSPYSGVSLCRRTNRWQAYAHLGSHALAKIWLGRFDNPELAAWVADFARYLCFGLNPVTWHHNAGVPNFPPLATNEYLRSEVIRKLLRKTKLDVELLRSRLVEYDRLAT